FLRPAVVPAEAGDHLVEDEERAILAAQLLHFVQEAILRLDAFRRLENESGNGTLVALEQRLDAGNIVVLERAGEAPDGLRYAGTHGCRADEPVVGGEERVIGAAGHQIAA